MAMGRRLEGAQASVDKRCKASAPETNADAQHTPTPASVVVPLPGPQIPLQAGCPQRGDRKACWLDSGGFGPQRQTGSQLGTRWSRVFASGHVPSRAPGEVAGVTASIRPTTRPAAASPVCTSPAGPTHLLAGLSGLLSSLCAQLRTHPALG